MKKQIISILTAAVCASTALLGCSSGKESSKGGKTESVTTTSKTTTTTTTATTTTTTTAPPKVEKYFIPKHIEHTDAKGLSSSVDITLDTTGNKYIIDWKYNDTQTGEQSGQDTIEYELTDGKITKAKGPQGYETYTYNDKGWLIEADKISNIGEAANVTQKYEYDEKGNITFNSSHSYFSDSTSTYEYNENDRITTAKYSSNYNGESYNHIDNYKYPDNNTYIVTTTNADGTVDETTYKYNEQYKQYIDISRSDEYKNDKYDRYDNLIFRKNDNGEISAEYQEVSKEDYYRYSIISYYSAQSCSSFPYVFDTIFYIISVYSSTYNYNKAVNYEW